MNQLPFYTGCIDNEYDEYSPQIDAGGSSSLEIKGDAPPQRGYNGYHQENITILAVFSIYPSGGILLAKSIIKQKGHTDADHHR